jgi:hypothetical protein
MLWQLLFSLVTGGFSKAADTYRDVKYAQIEKETATNNVVRDIQLKRLDNEEKQQQNAKEIRLATKDFWEIRLTVGIIAFVSALHYAAIVFDSIYHFGWAIAELPDPFNDYEIVILLSFFGYGTVKSGINAVIVAILRKGK